MTFFVRKKKWILVLFFTILINEIYVPQIYAEEIRIQSKGCAVMDANSGRIIFEKDGNTHLPNASTTKILTCILALEKSDLKENVVFSKEAAKQPEVKLGIGESNSLSMEDALCCMMLESYNDCAYAIAETVSGSILQFRQMMNQKAKEIGAKNSHFVTPNGLDDSDEEGEHYSSAIDLCKIMRYCCKESPKAPKFLEISQKKEMSVKGSNNVAYSISNLNKLLYSESGNVAGKTGYTSKAGYCYVGYFISEKKEYIITVLGCGWPGNNVRWKEVQNLLAYNEKRYELYTVSLPTQLLSLHLTYNGYKKEPSLEQWNMEQKVCFSIKGTGMIFQKRAEQLIEREIFIEENMESVIQGEEIGWVLYTMEGEELARYSIEAEETIKKWDNTSLFWAILRVFYS